MKNKSLIYMFILFFYYSYNTEIKFLKKNETLISILLLIIVTTTGKYFFDNYNSNNDNYFNNEDEDSKEIFLNNFSPSINDKEKYLFEIKNINNMYDMNIFKEILIKHQINLDEIIYLKDKNGKSEKTSFSSEFKKKENLFNEIQEYTNNIDEQIKILKNLNDKAEKEKKILFIFDKYINNIKMSKLYFDIDEKYKDILNSFNK